MPTKYISEPKTCNLVVFAVNLQSGPTMTPNYLAVKEGVRPDLIHSLGHSISLCCVSLHEQTDLSTAAHACNPSIPVSGIALRYMSSRTQLSRRRAPRRCHVLLAMSTQPRRRTMTYGLQGIATTSQTSEHRPIWRRVIDFVFGYDFFISYSWGDGGLYAEALARQLEAYS